MEEQLISIEVAKLAKEKGFDIPCKFVVNKEGYEDAPSYTGEDTFSNFEVKNAIDNTEEEHYLAPTQSLLAKWLRDSHKIEVFVLPIFREKCGYDSFKRDGFSFEVIKVSPCVYLDYFAFNKCGEDRDNSEDNPFFNKTFHSYEFCLEHALQEALKLI